MLHVKANCGPDKRQHVAWAPGDLNLTDGLTKDTAESRKPLALWQARRTWIIRYDEGFMSARKRQKANRQAAQEQQPVSEPSADECTFLDLRD